jgi:hypothetical protein
MYVSGLESMLDEMEMGLGADGVEMKIEMDNGAQEIETFRFYLFRCHKSSHFR